MVLLRCAIRMLLVGQSVLDDAEAAAGQAEEAATASRKKRRVAAENGGSIPSAPLSLEATASLPGHVHCVAAVAWARAETVFSGGWDHSVRRYDVESRTNTDTYNGSKAVYAVAAPADGSSSSLVAFGGSDKVLRVWDTRGVSGEGVAVKAYAAHEGWISSVSWRPDSSCHVVTGGHDGAVKLWDIRTAVPLGSLQQHQEDSKVLCVGWWGGQTLASGGSDCRVQLYSMP
jgi:ribosome biogenesis protein YTM1